MATSFKPTMQTDPTPPSGSWIEQIQDSRGFEINEWGAASSVSTADVQDAANATEAAYQQGEAAGRALAEKEFAEAQTAHAQFKLKIEGINADLQSALKAALASTVVSLCEQIVEPAWIERAALNTRCQAAIARLSGHTESLTLHLHPDDLELVELPSEGAPKLVANTNLTRGSIQLESTDGFVSDRPEDWRRILQETLGQC